MQYFLLFFFIFVTGNANDETISRPKNNNPQCFTNYTLVAECETIAYNDTDLILTTFTYSNGAIYEGYIDTNDEYINANTHVLNGRGKIHFKSGAFFVGYFVDSKRHGWGTHTYVDGSVYTGCWGGDKKQGRGRYAYGSDHVHPGAEYVGEWQGGYKHGHGEYFSPHIQYCGDFVQGKFHGVGQLLQHQDEAFYEGQFRDNLFWGYGSMQYGNGNIYVGDWVSGTKSGTGRFVDAASAVTYTGGWEGDVMHGTGRLLFAADGFEMPGEWVMGSLLTDAARTKAGAATAAGQKAMKSEKSTVDIF
jgi:hypothetical protein